MRPTPEPSRWSGGPPVSVTDKTSSFALGGAAVRPSGRSRSHAVWRRDRSLRGKTRNAGESGLQHSDRLINSDRASGARRATDGPAGIRLRLVRWRRRHLNVRTVVVVVLLSALLA